jgi:hypothetical protein
MEEEEEEKKKKKRTRCNTKFQTPFPMLLN